MLNLKKLRLEKKYSIPELAKLSGVSRTYLIQIEKGLYVNIGIEILCRLCRALNVTPNELINESFYKQI